MTPILQAEGISKSFPGVQALRDVTFGVFPGEVHGLVGENGAGKSTLMHILAGVYSPDSGSIRVENQEVVFRNERDAQAQGIGMVYQERSLVPELSIAENVFAGRQPVDRFNLVKTRQMLKDTQDLLALVGMEIDPRVHVGELTSIKQQLVEIAKALSLKAKILILDEPTATITQRETGILFSLIKQLQERGMAIVYISHRLQELPHVCTRVSVLKDGVHQGTRKMSEVSLDQIVQMMVGRSIVYSYDDRGIGETESIFEVHGMSSTAFTDVSFQLKRQEILGIAGLAGAGRTELALAIFGADPKSRGEIYLDGRQVRIDSPSRAIELGIGYLTEDRKAAGLFLDMDIPNNLAAANLDRFSSRGLVRGRKLLEATRRYVKELKIATPSIKQIALNLSGGNQQKMLMARWLMREPRILIIDEPTRGVDVGAKNEIYNLIRTITRGGASVIVISSELPEILTLCDRIIVMWQGQKTGELSRKDATEDKIMRLASGIGGQSIPSQV